MYSASFRVNIYDVDAFGELRASALLRFLQQAASDASATVGYDVDWYDREGTLWVIRRTEAELGAPAGYRDELEVRTWVSDIRRVRSQREYDVRRVGDGAVIARAATDWVYVDLRRGAPVRPPAHMQERLMPVGVAVLPRRTRLSATVPDGAYRIERRVEFADLDSVAHVNNAHYAVYVEQATWDALAARGWTVDPTARAARPRLRGLDFEYFESAQYGDPIEAAVWVSARDAGRFTVECRLVRGHRALLAASCTWEWTDAAMPAALRDAVAALALTPG